MVDDLLITEALPASEASPSPPPGQPAESAAQSPENLLNVLQMELKDLKKSFADLKRQNLPEIEQVRQQLRETISERDTVAGELNTLRRKNTVSDLAKQYGFTDAEYLDFILQKNQIDPAQDDLTGKFMQGFKQNHPRYFALPVKPGAGSRPGSAPEGIHAIHSNNRMDNLEILLSNAPEII